MASASSLMSEEHFLCSICMDVLTVPVTIPCGHNYCKTCITHYWDTNVCRCPLCKETFNKRPKASVNTFISEMVHQFRSRMWKEEYKAKTEDEVQQMIEERRVKIQEVERSVELSRKDADTVMADSVQVFNGLNTSLIECIQRSQADFIRVTEEEQKTTEKQAERFIKEMKREITQLEKRSSELKHLSNSEDHLLQNVTTANTPPPTKDWTNVKVHQSSVCLLSSAVRTAVAQLEKTLSQEMERKLRDVELRRIQKYAMDVTLDPDTAHPELILSEDGKQVSHGGEKKKLPKKKERFSCCACVLGKQSFSSGRFYYEVQVTGKTEWALGVARESIKRKGQITLKPNNGYWSIWLDVNEYEALADPAVQLTVREEVQKVGVFVDYEEGLVSFYDVEARVHLYAFTGCTFTEKLYPYFSPSLNEGGTNSAPLIISPVNMGAGLGGNGANMSPPVSKRRKT